MKNINRNELQTFLDCSPRSNMRMYELLDEIDKDEIQFYTNRSAILIVSDSIMFWAKHEADLVPLLKYIPTSNASIELFCIEHHFLPILKTYFLDVSIRDDCYIWELDSLIDGRSHLDSLTLADVPYVNDHWEFKDDESLEFIQWCLKTLPSSCIRDERGNPIAMAFCYGQSPDYVNMGALQVFPVYRKQGYGRLITLDLCKKVLASNRKPIVYIRIDNGISQHLCQKIGFKKYERVIWGQLIIRKER